MYHTPYENLEKELSYLPFDTIVCYEGYGTFDSKIYSECFVDAVALLKPTVALVGGTPIGKSTAALASGLLETGLTADCTELQMDDEGRLIQIRPAFGGNVIAEIVTEYARPQMATIRPNTFEAYKKNQMKHTPAFISGSISPKRSYEIMDTIPKKTTKKNIRV